MDKYRTPSFFQKIFENSRKRGRLEVSNSYLLPFGYPSRCRFSNHFSKINLYSVVYECPDTNMGVPKCIAVVNFYCFLFIAVRLTKSGGFTSGDLGLDETDCYGVKKIRRKKKEREKEEGEGGK